MQLINETENIGNMFDDVTTNDLFKLIVTEWIRKGSQIVNDIRMTPWICIDTNCTRKLVLTTPDIKNFLCKFR